MAPALLKKQQAGSVIVIAMATLLVILIFVPALVYFIKQESKSSAKQKKSTIAFHMAEAGIDRAAWKLQESDQIWSMASTGSVIPGYNFDVIYASTDSASQLQGEYVIKITTYAATATAVRVLAVGRDKSTNEERAIEAVYTKSAGGASLSVRGTLRYKAGLKIHWGPVINYSNIIEEPNDTYPRKITKGYITGYDEDPNAPNGHDFYSTWPDPATYDYNTYQTKVGNPPNIRKEDYIALAKATRYPALKVPSGNGAAVANPVGSGYYTESVDICGAGGNGNNIRFYCSTCVLYVEGNVDMKDAASQIRVQALIVTGDFDMNADDVPNYKSRIPIGAEQEYLEPAAQTYWNANFAATGEGNVYTITDEVKVHGYVYVGGTSNSGGGNPAVVGILDVVGNMSVNNTLVFYDSAVSTSVLVSGLTPTLQSWREFRVDEIEGLSGLGP